MSEITIQIPPLEDINQHVEVEVKINGERLMYNYRVEQFEWQFDEEDMSSSVASLKRMIADYDDGWQLFQIGTPTEKAIPVMFRQKGYK